MELSRQGEVLSPILFITIVDYIIKEIYKKTKQLHVRRSTHGKQ